MDRGAWRAAVHRVTQSQTRLKRLSSSSSSSDISHGYDLLKSDKFDKMYQEEKKISCLFIQGPFSGDKENKKHRKNHMHQDNHKKMFIEDLKQLNYIRRNSFSNA